MFDYIEHMANSFDDSHDLDRRLARDAEREPHTVRQRIALCVGGALRTHFLAKPVAPARAPKTAHFLDTCDCAKCRAFAAVDWSREFERSLTDSSQRKQLIPVVKP